MTIAMRSKADAGKAYEQAEKFSAGKQSIGNRLRGFIRDHEVGLATGGFMGYMSAIAMTATNVSPTAGAVITGLGIGLPAAGIAAAAGIDAIRNKISNRKASER